VYRGEPGARGARKQAYVAMPVALALLSLEQGGQPLLMVPAEGFAMGSATAALQQFVALAAVDTRLHGAHELCLPTGSVVHYKVLPGGAILVTALCEAWENPYEGKEALADLETVICAPHISCFNFSSIPHKSLPCQPGLAFVQTAELARNKEPFGQVDIASCR